MSEYTICTVRCLLGGHFDTVNYALLGAHTNALCTVHDMHYVGSKQYAHSMQYVQLCIGKGCPKLSTTLLHNLVSASRALSCTAGLAPSGLAFWPNIHKYKYKYKFKYWWLHHMHLVAGLAPNTTLLAYLFDSIYTNTNTAKNQITKNTCTNRNTGFCITCT